MDWAINRQGSSSDGGSAQKRPTLVAGKDAIVVCGEHKARPRVTSRYTAVSNAMDTSKREPTLTDLLSDPVMVTLLERARQTSDDMRAMVRGSVPQSGWQSLRDAWEMVTRASEASEPRE